MRNLMKGFVFFLGTTVLCALYTNCSQLTPSSGDANQPSIGQQAGLAGGESSGGGNSVRSPITNKYILLDYFTFSPTHHDTFTTVSGSPLVKTDYQFPEYNNAFEALPASQPAYSKVLDRLNVWAASTGDLKSRLLTEVKLSFAAMPTVPQAGRYDLGHLSSQYPNLEIQPLACFDAERAQSVWSYNLRIVYLNETIWNQLDSNSQAGLILHEMLRQLQLGNAVPLPELGDGSDKALQDLTSKIMLTDPI